MRGKTGIRVLLVALTAFAAMPMGALAGDIPAAAKLSAALGGVLGHGMYEAGGAGHGRFDAAAELRAGRNEAFRKRVLGSNASARMANSVHADHARQR
jgi:hypothetical protein